MSDYELFHRTIDGLDQTFTVGLISTFDLVNIDVNGNPQKWFEDYPGFDQCPVVDGNKTVGILDRDQYEPSSANWFSSLTDQILISNDTPLSKFLPMMLDTPYYRFVLKDSKVAGIVTRSDLLKLPVRLYAFAHLTHMELLMAVTIQANYPNDQWLQLLTEDRENRIVRDFNFYKNENTDPPLIEFTSLKDKAKILDKALKLDGKLSKDAKKLYELRNKVAHSGNYAENHMMLDDFIEKLKLVNFWIDKLSELEPNQVLKG